MWQVCGTLTTRQKHFPKPQTPLSLFLDGALVGRMDAYGFISGNALAPFWIGVNPLNPAARPMNGFIDYVQVHSNALSKEALLQSAAEAREDHSPQKVLKAGYEFNGSAVDSTGQFNGSLENGARVTASSAVFDGNDDYIDTGKWNLTGNTLNIEARVKFAGFGVRHEGRILSKANGTSEQSHYFMVSTIDVDGKKRLRLRLKVAGVTHTLIAEQGDLTVNRWYKVNAVYDDDRMALMLDDVAVGTKVVNGTISGNDFVPVWIGGNPINASARPFEGQIDYIHIYNPAGELP